MRTTELASAGRWVSQEVSAWAFAILRALLLIAAAGFVAAAIGPLLGRHLRVGLAMPLVGSVAVTLPRVLILLMVLWRVNHTGVLTAAAIVEVCARLTMGLPGLMPMALVVPVLAAMVADAVWQGSKGWRKIWLRLAVTGAVLAATRVVAAWMLLTWAIFLPPGIRMPTTAAGCAIIIINILLGFAAGMVVARLRQYRWGGR